MGIALTAGAKKHLPTEKRHGALLWMPSVMVVEIVIFPHWISAKIKSWKNFSRGRR
jgi:hypothetical protein